MRTPESDARGLKDWLDALPEARRKTDRAEARQAAAQRRQVLEALRESLRQLMDERGYSTREVVALLKQKGVVVAVSTLHAHVRKARAAQAPASPAAEAIRPRPRRGASLARPAPPASPVPEPVIETSAVAVPSRRPVEAPPVGSPAAPAWPESALTDALSPSLWSPDRPAAPEDDPPPPAPGTFVPRPERPIDWYRPSSRNGTFNGASDD